MSRSPSRHLHFTEAELADRRRRTTDRLAARGLDGMLVFRQESMYWLTGYDTFGYVFFQCLYLGADGAMTILTRAPDVGVARFTSVVDDVRMWVDGPHANPSEDLRAVLDEHGRRGSRLGVEWDAYGLTARNGRRLADALDGFCALEDASELVSGLRAVKSDAELAYVRRAAALADEALAVARDMARPGIFEGDILAAMQGAVFRGDGDYPGNEFIIGSGPKADFGRYISGRRHLGDDDLLTIEHAGVYRHYHACLMRTLKVGRPSERHRELHRIGVDTLRACQAALVPGRPIGDVYEVYADVLARHRLGQRNACGYGLGTTFAPNWMDWPMLYRDNPLVAEPGMVFFIHMHLCDEARGVVATPGETVVVTDGGCERLSTADLDVEPA